EPGGGVARRDRREREGGVVLHGRDRPPDPGRRAPVDRGPAGGWLSQRDAVDVGPERHEPGGSPVAQEVRQQSRSRGRRLRANELPPRRGLGEDPLGVPDGYGRRRRLGARETARRAVYERRDAEREPFEPPPPG